MVRSWFVGFATVVAAIVLSAAIPAYASHVLITEEEAKLPPPRSAVATDRRGVTRRAGDARVLARLTAGKGGS